MHPQDDDRTVKATCEWSEEDPWGSMPDTWQTSCGNLFSFTDGGPTENEMKFCCYCGKRLAEIKHSNPDEDE